MTEPSTCGQGLAHHAVLPRTTADLVRSIADNLSAHLETVVGADTAAHQERTAYDDIAERLRTAAAMLEAIGDDMTSHRDMPMPEHDLAAMSSPTITSALETMVKRETELAELLTNLSAEHQSMLKA